MQDYYMEFDVVKVKINKGMENFKKIYLSEHLNELEKYQKVTVNPMVETRKKGLLGKFTVFFKRICRKIVAWYLQPVCDDQTRYNQQAYLLLSAMNEMLALQIEEYKEQCMTLQKEQHDLRLLLDKINEEISSLKCDNDKIQ